MSFALPSQRHWGAGIAAPTPLAPVEVLGEVEDLQMVALRAAVSPCNLGAEDVP